MYCVMIIPAMPAVADDGVEMSPGDSRAGGVPVKMVVKVSLSFTITTTPSRNILS